jgi:hypothetical protein
MLASGTAAIGGTETHFECGAILIRPGRSRLVIWMVSSWPDGSVWAKPGVRGSKPTTAASAIAPTPRPSVHPNRRIVPPSVQV